MSRTLDDFLAAEAAETAPLAQPEMDPSALVDEVVVDRRTGAVRQAGADTSGEFIAGFKRAAERSLFTFCVGVLGRTYLTRGLHEPVCDWLTDFTVGRRKGLLLPREHAKTSIVAHGMPCHMFIQPAEENIYFPGMAGSDTTIVLACETEERGADHVRVIESAFESNEILRGLWPHVCWDKPRQQSKKWNDSEMIVAHPHRETEFPDPSLRTIGVGGAITGAHPLVLLKDDLISDKAADSPALMHTAIEWHRVSRALINRPDCIEIIDGTRWAAYDLYRFIQEEDASVQWLIRRALEDGQPIYPERFSLATLDRLRQEFGIKYPLLYLNTAIDAALTDFDMAEVRAYRIVGRQLVFDEDARDAILADRVAPGQRLADPGMADTPRRWDDPRRFGGADAHRLRGV